MPVVENFHQVVDKMVKHQRTNCPDLGIACGFELDVGGIDAVTTSVKEPVVAEPFSGCVTQIDPSWIEMTELGLVRNYEDFGSVIVTGHQKVFDAGHRRRHADVIAVNLTLQALPIPFAAGMTA